VRSGALLGKPFKTQDWIWNRDGREARKSGWTT
jgi:hypothetical protein